MAEVVFLSSRGGVEIKDIGLDTKSRHMQTFSPEAPGGSKLYLANNSANPFPYNGTTTTCDSFWMGVPVVTLAGKNHVSRVGLSLVSHLGFPEWGVETADAYVAKCRELAADLPGLARLRLGLREQMRRSPICDAPRFIVHVETAFRQMWQQWCQPQTNGPRLPDVPPR